MCHWQKSSVGKAKKKEALGITGQHFKGVKDDQRSSDLILAVRVALRSPTEAVYSADSLVNLKCQLCAGGWAQNVLNLFVLGRFRNLGSLV